MSCANKKKQRIINNSQKQFFEKSSEKSFILSVFLSNQDSSQQSRSNNSQDSSKNSESDFKKSKAITSDSKKQSINKQVKERDIAEAATFSDSKTQDNNKNKNKQKVFKILFLAYFQNIQSKIENKKSLFFTTELKRIEKCADNNFYDILGFSSNSNNINLTIQTQRYIQLTQLIYSDKIQEKFKTHINRATQRKIELYKMLDFTEY